MHRQIQGLAAWTAFLGTADLPVLKQTARQIANLGTDPKLCNARSLGHIVGHDPMMTVKLLQLFGKRRGHRAQVEVCRIEQMVVMIGVESFLKDLPPTPVVQELLLDRHEALSCLLHAVLRAQHAAHAAPPGADGLRRTLPMDGTSGRAEVRRSNSHPWQSRRDPSPAAGRSR